MEMCYHLFNCSLSGSFQSIHSYDKLRDIVRSHKFNSLVAHL